MLRLKIAFIVTFIAPFYVVAQSYEDIIDQAIESYKTSNYKLSYKKYLLAFDIDKTNARDLYNGACSAALSGKKKESIGLLSVALEQGWNNLDHLQKDSDLYNIHPLKEWEEIIKKARLADSLNLTKLELIDKVTLLIESRDINQLLGLFGKEKQKNINKNQLKLLVENINSTIHKSRTEKIKNAMTSTQSSSGYSNGIPKITFTKTFGLVTPYFGKLYNKVMSRVLISANFSITLEYSNYKWELQELNLLDKYLESSHNIFDDLNSFVKNRKQMKYQYMVVIGDKVIKGTGHLEADSVKFLFELKDLNYVNQDTSMYLKENEPASLISLWLIKESTNWNWMEPAISDPNGFFANTTKEVNEIELIFSTHSKELMVSNGKKYAFYESNQLMTIRNYIISLLTNDIAYAFSELLETEMQN